MREIYLAFLGTLPWVGVLFAPWGPWRVREVLDSKVDPHPVDLSDITVLIPARNEAVTVQPMLTALDAQGAGMKIVLIDDQSDDDTIRFARAATQNLQIVSVHALPAGWSGKLWALEQGRRYVHTPFTLLLDADIELRPGILATLRERMQHDNLALGSLMASLRMQSFWERLLMPAFIYFFKLLYPFHLSNMPHCRQVAAAAGGCVLLRTRVLEEIGGFHSLRDALIDDCTLAERVKSLGYRTWVGLTHSVRSLRAYDGLAGIWNMVARSAFTQLHYSIVRLLACTAIFIVAFWIPPAALMLPDAAVRMVAATTLGAMMLSYLPTLRFYSRSPAWALAMPLIGSLYLAMTWTSAVRYWCGRRSYWKERTYTKTLDPGSG
ncbi:MAG: glycosyltransferase [Acidiferrobacterales bacterium]